MVTLADGGLSGGEVAGLIVAVFWAVLVCFIGYVLIKLGNVVGEAGKLVSGVTDETVPLLTEVRTSVVHVNAELERLRADRRVRGHARLTRHQGRCVLLRRPPRAGGAA